jgi:hypothetical protein
MKPEYIGDGVYVEHDGYRFILKVNDYDNPSDIVALEPEVFANLIKYAEKLKATNNEGEQLSFDFDTKEDEE